MNNLNIYGKVQEYIQETKLYSHILNFPLTKELKIVDTTIGYSIEGFFYSKSWESLIEKCEYIVHLDKNLSLVDLQFKN